MDPNDERDYAEERAVGEAYREECEGDRKIERGERTMRVSEKFWRAIQRPVPIPRCGACHRPVGEGNEIRDQVGGIITACRTCAGPAPRRGEGCNCWVRDRPAEEQFSIRYGAHDVKCPAWAPSRDPVDAANDAELRLRLDRP